ncbi:hypothetical protein M3Y94_01274100 [Aphelenchoides besseyi]|nr:hypothetical protein M3Y94_01274100 [Aphelenchoides besseyi]KAI6222662.1 hypothetical protein M3Y95_00917300 [Aphelenchoides besseyi]
MLKLPMNRINVHIGSRIIALIGLSLCVISAVPLIINHVYYSSVNFYGSDGFNSLLTSGFTTCVYLMALGTNAGLLVGNLTKQKLLYLPFIFVNVSFAFVFSMILLWLAVFGGIGLLYPDPYANSTTDLSDRLEPANEGREIDFQSSQIASFALMLLTLMAFIVVMSIFLAIYLFVIYVVWKGYRFLCKYENLSDSIVKESSECEAGKQFDGRI